MDLERYLKNYRATLLYMAMILTLILIVRIVEVIH
jgi:hypothetical protein